MCARATFIKSLFMLALGGSFLFGLTSFTDINARQLATQIEQKLNISHNETPENGKVKRVEISLSDGFLRYRRFFTNGKQEYFSFNIQRFDDLDYLGTSSQGVLILHTRDEDVIVQTYNDPKGNIDSMANIINLPVKQMEAEELQMIRENLFQIKKELQN